jgi:uncharacterized protein
LIQTYKKLVTWYLKGKIDSMGKTKGTFLLFHAYSGQKAGMLDKTQILQDLGFNNLLLDFAGSGDSEGNQVTLGYKEAAQVKTAYDYIKSRRESTVYLFGTSMGSMVIMKA